MLTRVKRSLRQRGIQGFFGAAFADALAATSKHLARIRDGSTRYRFIDRRAHKDGLIVVLAGYKSFLWPTTLERIYSSQHDDCDVCVVSPGLYSEELKSICEKNNWSYLSVQRNSPGVALNQAVSLHPGADYIFKLDEDIVISPGFFSAMRIGYQRVLERSMLEPGFCAPVLNINGITYYTFLRTLGLEEEYKSMFGPLVMRCQDVPVHNNPEAAWWIWSKTLPFREIADRFSNGPERFSICSTRFSIGAILFRRQFWEMIGGFKSAWHAGILGVDEDMLCRDCVSFSRPMYIVETVLAGHFSFYPQEALMKRMLPEMSRLDPDTFPPQFFAAPRG
ncbi:MAG TPA: hypothetical protein VNO84_16900 [Burkholderiaceae bacterium]|nr:hypothetical protein [Burkholderiaceae bacterium]